MCSTARWRSSDAVDGVEPQSETVWRQADRYRVPRIAFVNKMDRVGADFFTVVEQMRTKLRANPVAVQIPLGSEDTFLGVVDLIEGCAYVLPRGDAGRRIRARPRSRRSSARSFEKWREKLLEVAAEHDERLARALPRRRDAGRRRGSCQPARADRRAPHRAGALRLGVQEQGRAAAARRRRGLPAVAARHPADRGAHARRRAGDQAGRRRRALRRRSRSRS